MKYLFFILIFNGIVFSNEQLEEFESKPNEKYQIKLDKNGSTFKVRTKNWNIKQDSLYFSYNGKSFTEPVSSLDNINIYDGRCVISGCLIGFVPFAMMSVGSSNSTNFLARTLPPTIIGGILGFLTKDYDKIDLNEYRKDLKVSFSPYFFIDQFGLGIKINF